MADPAVKVDALVDFDMLDADLAEFLLQPFELLDSAPVVPPVRDVHVTDVDAFINDQKKANTVSRTIADIKNVQRWLYDCKHEIRSVENILPERLNDYLAELFIGIRKRDGGDYDPISLECIKNSIERYLKEKGYKASLKDRVFHKAMAALQAKKRELAKRGKGKAPNKSEHLTPDEEDQLYQCGAFGDTNPRNLQTTLFYHFGTQFGLRARDEARQLKFGDIELKLSTTGEKYLQFCERTSKTRDGTNLKVTRDTIPRIYSTGQLQKERDPVKLYEAFVERRPTEMLDPESPFYLTPIPQNRLAHGTRADVWYYPRPMGHNCLGNLLKNAAAEANLQKKVTNHSVRKTTVTKLSRTGVAPQKIMKITGHRSIQSITHYDASLTESEQKQMCGILQGQSKENQSPLLKPLVPVPCPPEPVSTPLNPESESSKMSNIQRQFPGGCVFNNCSFHF